MKANRSQIKLQQAQQLIQQGDLRGAQQTLKGLLRKHPRDLNIVALSGQVYGMLGDHAQAEQVFASVSHLSAIPAPLLFNLGLSQAQQGKRAEALGSYQKALKLDPGNPKYLANISTNLIDLGRYTEAQRWIEQWIERAPGSTDPLLQQAICYQAAQQWDAATHAYLVAIEQGADPYQCYLNLSAVAHKRGDLFAAIDAAKQALALQPGCPVAHYNLGSYYLALGEITQATTLWHKISTLRSKPSHHMSVESALLYATNLSPQYDPQSVYEAHLRIGAALPGSERSAPLSETLGYRLQHSEPPLRVGFISEGFHQHPIGFFMTALLDSFDPSRISPILIAQLEHPDTLSARLQQRCTQWIDITGAHDAKATLLIAEAEIDILVDLDSHTSSRISLLSRRHAPVQVSYLGYPNTSGMASIDYRITDAVVDPESSADHFYSEQLIRLNRPFFCYQPPAIDVAIEVTAASATRPVMFGSFNKAEKVNDHVIELWSRVLTATPGSRLLLQMAILSQPAGKAWMVERFAQYGIQAERLKLCGWSSLQGYLQRHNEVDLILDTQPWNGHTNTCHALWMGVPTLTLMGNHFAARFGGLIMNAVDCPEFVVEDEHRFVSRAAELCADREQLEDLKRSLRQRLLSSALCDGEDFSRQMEQSFYRMWTAQQAAVNTARTQ